MPFDDIVHAKGERYLELRNQLLHDANLDKMIEERRGDTSWGSTLARETLERWNADSELCRRVGRVLLGTDAALNPGKYPTGGAPSPECVKALQEIGLSAAAVVLEHIYKCTTERTLESFFVSVELLTRWKEPRLRPVLRSIFFDASEPREYRAVSMQTLVTISSPDLERDMLKIFNDPNEKEEMRSFVLKGMGRVGKPETMKTLVEVVSDQKMTLQLRIAAVLGLGSTGDSGIVSLLADVFMKTKDKQLREAVVDALGASGVRKAEDILKRWKDVPENGWLAKKIDLALWKLSLVK